MNILITSIVDLEKTPNSRLHHVISHLVEQKHNVIVISIKDFWKKTVSGQDELLKKIKIIYVTEDEQGPLQQKISGVLNLNKLLGSIDLKKIDIHYCYNSVVLGYYIAKKLKLFGVNTVYDLADDLPAMVRTSPYIPKMVQGFAGSISDHMLRSCLGISSVVIITANEFRKSMGVDSYTHVLIPNGVDIERFIPTHTRHKGVVVGYLGALREWVDLRPMLLAVKELNYKDLTVTVVGGEEGLPEYKEFVMALGIAHKVKFTGNVPFADVPKYIAGFDIATIPFRKNKVTNGTCPLKLLEYMAMERPVICSQLSEIRAMVSHKVLYADDEVQWEKAIELLYKDAKLRKKYGEVGRKFIISRYSWKDICARIEEQLRKYSKRI